MVSLPDMSRRISELDGVRPEDLGGDIFSHLLSTHDSHSGERLNAEEIQSECQLLSVAGKSRAQPPRVDRNSSFLPCEGFDTVSSASCATIFYLAHYPHAHTRLVNEIRIKFPSSADIEPGEKLKGCEYLNACIDESLRISPPFCTFAPREVEEGGENIDGNLIPEGYAVGASVYAIQRSPEYFPQPNVYLAEPWLTTKDSSPHSAFVPFSMGPRACIGRLMAISELQTTIALFVWTFDFKLADGDHEV
ncbi:cytochrome P450 [Penicillium alfredii]|uniref:Cytochrome P450 n=1 Tax=Penicillium alfredii TaxID=1506179 RepID=A0A9W9F1A1_9EURO|nr:cytochrome P450 [Penicillium alfredii]KAJ5091773.1 cytochrome P450 [Penicillium alfredii]